MDHPPLLEVSELGRTFPGASGPVVEGVSFTVAPGEIFALVGPSGCGKSTTLRMIAGFEIQDTGRILLEGRDISGAAPETRRIGIVFQDYALFPHLTCLDNIAFGIRAGDRRTARHEALKFIDMVGLAGLGPRYPDQLSGGQQQRVALARTLAAQPRLILLDEPFSNLDAALRHHTRREIRALLKESGIGAVFVTHDQEEALSFADRIAIMRRGRIEQIGPPEEVYANPHSAFVARFLGRTNLLPGIAQGHEASTPLGRVALATPAHGDVLLSLRPEHLVLNEAPDAEATVVARDFKGHDITYWVAQDGHEYQVDTGFSSALRPGTRVRLRPRAPAIIVTNDICAMDTDV